MGFPIATFFEAIGGLGGGLGAAIAVGGVMRTNRVQREETQEGYEKAAEEKEREDRRWKQHVAESLDGRPPTRSRPGFLGVIDRVSNLERDRWGDTKAAVEPSGPDR